MRFRTDTAKKEEVMEIKSVIVVTTECEDSSGNNVGISQYEAL